MWALNIDRAEERDDPVEKRSEDNEGDLMDNRFLDHQTNHVRLEAQFFLMLLYSILIDRWEIEQLDENQEPIAQPEDRLICPNDVLIENPEIGLPERG